MYLLLWNVMIWNTTVNAAHNRPSTNYAPTSCVILSAGFRYQCFNPFTQRLRHSFKFFGYNSCIKPRRKVVPEHDDTVITITMTHTWPQERNYSSFSSWSNRANTTSLLVSSISPARNTSSKIAYTLHNNMINQGYMRRWHLSTL